MTDLIDTLSPTDVIDTLAGIAPGSALDLLRRERGEIRDRTQGAYRELLLPEAPGGVSQSARAMLAACTAELEGAAALAEWFRGLPGGGDAGGDRLLSYGAMVALHPGRVDQAVIDGMLATGLSPQDLVAVTQLVAFVPFQTRLLAGLRAMAGQPGASPLPRPAAAAFTMEEVAWSPRVPPVTMETATPAQLAALEACPPAVRQSIYFRTLALDPASLEQRGALFNGVMYAPRGLKRADRELATAVVSMVNGCVYCCSVHARRFTELTKEGPVMQALLHQGFGAPLDARRAAIVGFAARLTATPHLVGAEDLVPVRAAGIDGLELLDLVHAIAMFANANRLMQALGESVSSAAA